VLLLTLGLLIVNTGPLIAQTVVATITVGANPHGILVDPTADLIYVADNSDGTVSVIDSLTNNVIDTITVGVNPDGIGISPATSRIYVSNNGDDNVSVIDTLTRTVIATIPVGDHPQGVGVIPGATDRIYVTNDGDDNVSVIDGLAVTTTIPVGSHPDGLCVNPSTNKVYVTNNGGTTVSVIEGLAVTGTITVGANPYGVVVDPATNRVYVTNTGSGTVSVIEGLGVIDTITVGTVPAGIGFNPTTNRLYLADFAGNRVFVINVLDNSVVGPPVTVGAGPRGVGVDPTTDRIYVTNSGGTTVSVIAHLSAPTTTSLSPAGTTAGSGAFTLTVNGTGFISSSVVRWNGVACITTYVSANQVTASIPAANVQTAGTASVTVFNPDEAESNAQTFTITKLNNPIWYLAEGTTGWGFSTYITIENPQDEELHARVTYSNPFAYSGSGEIARKTVTLPAKSQTTIGNDAIIDAMGGVTDFSTVVECLEGKSIAVDRTMTWTGKGAPGPEGHNSIGVTAPAKTWYLPEGSSEWGFETWTLVQNPNPIEANVTLTYMTEHAGAKVVAKKIPANSRATYNMASDIGSHDSSIKVTSDIPVIAERSQYRSNRREGSCSIGTTAPASDYFLAEGTTAWGFTTYVLVQNPQDSPTDVTITYMTPGGPKTQPVFTMPPNSRKTIRVNDIKPSAGDPIDVSNTDLSIQVHGSAPIIAERAMYWNNGTGEACHDSIGLSSPHMSFFLPDGQTSDGRETWTLIQNPNPEAVTVEISYLSAGGGTPVSFTETIPPNSRKTYNMAGAGNTYPGIQGRASVTVHSLDGARPVMVERSMYWNNKGAGTDTIGGYSD